jgi:hypothetical protein
MKDLDKYLDSIGEKGSIERLEAISQLDLGARSESARKSLENRNRRKELMDKGLTFEHSVLIVNKENEIS